MRQHQHWRTMVQIVGLRVSERLELVISAEVQACAAVTVSTATLRRVGVAELPTIIHASFQRQRSPKSLNLRLCKMRAQIVGTLVTEQQVLVTSAELKDCVAGKVSAVILKSVGAVGRPTTTHASFPQSQCCRTRAKIVGTLVTGQPELAITVAQKDSVAGKASAVILKSVGAAGRLTTTHASFPQSQCCRTRAKIVGTLVTGQLELAITVAQKDCVAGKVSAVILKSVGAAGRPTTTHASFQRKSRACRTRAKIVGTLVTRQLDLAITVAQKVCVVVKVSPATLKNAEGGELQISTRALCLLRPRRRARGW